MRASIRFVFATSPKIDVSRGTSSVAELDRGEETEEEDIEAGGAGEGDTMVDVEVQGGGGRSTIQLDTKRPSHFLSFAQKMAQEASLLPTLGLSDELWKVGLLMSPSKGARREGRTNPVELTPSFPRSLSRSLPSSPRIIKSSPPEKVSF